MHSSTDKVNHLVINALVTPPQAVGIGNYIRELVRTLHEYRPSLKITIIGFMGYKSLLFSDINLAPNITSIELPVNYYPRYSSLAYYVLWMRLRLNKVLTDINADVFWHPNTAYLPKVSIPVVVTIHDLLEWDTDAYGMISTFYRKWVLGRYKERCNAVVTVSDFSAERIRFHYPELEKRIQVIPPFIKYKPITEPVVKEKLVLCVSNMKPYKNLCTLIQAFQASELPHNGWKLVICGRIDEAFRKKNDFLDDNTIYSTGYVDEISLANWYSKASVYVSPSTYEGFDLPVWEANHHGCKLILSDIPVHQSGKLNVFGLFEAQSIDTLRNVLNKLNK